MAKRIIKAAAALILGLAVVVPVATITTGCSAVQQSSETYQGILDDYTTQLENKAPELVQQFNTEAAKLSSITEKSTLATQLTEQLAQISTEGTEKMAALMTKNGDDYSTYQDWATKLGNVYQEQAALISNAYMTSASGGLL